MTIDSWADQSQCNSRLAETCLMLNCPRECVGLVASSRGFMYGSLSIRFHSAAPMIHVRHLNSPGISISGSIMLSDIENIEVRSNARFILVIEKDGVYRRLIEDGLTRKIPGILVTACGFPDMATRYIIYCLWKKVNSFSYQIYKQTTDTAF
jgi:meiotic recombination protein SPO11